MPSSARSRGAVALAVFVFAAAVALAALPTAGAAAAGPAKGNDNLCRIKGLSAASSARAARASAVAHASDGIATGLTKFVLEKAVGVNIERYALMGMSNLLKLIDAKAITPLSPEQAVLNQLNAINARLGEMEARIGRVGDSVNQLTAERRQKDLDDEIREICDIANNQMYLYRLFRAAIETGAELGILLKGTNPSLADAPGRTGKSPRQIAQRDLDEFVDQYKITARASNTEIGRLGRALVPDPKAQSDPTVLKTYGLVMMAQNRFINRDHSEALRALYRDVAEIRALASWMAAEYWDARGNTREEDRVWDELLSDTRSGEASLPRIIPRGAIVDLGTAPRTSTDRKAMWVAPTDKDLGWLPRNNAFTFQFGIDEVPRELESFNRAEFGGNNWHAPDKQEFIALMSDNCAADPDHPNKVLVGCTNAVPGGANLAAYLQKINPDKTWQQLFCQSSVNPKCPKGAGPKGIRKEPRAFIWTSDLHSQRLICGTLRGAEHKNGAISIRVMTHAGYHTLGPIKHEVFPHLPMKIPHPRKGDGIDRLNWIEEGCGDYLRPLVYGVPKDDVKRNNLFEGVLLATRFTNTLDATWPLQLDYMAQPTPPR